MATGSIPRGHMSEVCGGHNRLSTPGPRFLQACNTKLEGGQAAHVYTGLFQESPRPYPLAVSEH